MAAKKTSTPDAPFMKKKVVITLVKDLKKQKAGARIEVSASTAEILKKKGFIK